MNKSDFVGVMSMGNFSKSERRRLDSIGTLWFKGQPFKKTDIVESGKYPCLHYGELFSKYGAIIDSVSSRCDALPKRLSQKGDILFPASDVTPAGLTRCSAIMQEDVILGGDVIGFRPHAGLNPIYLSYAIRHQKAQLLQRVTGALIKHISAKSLQSVIIPIHPIESQNRFEKQVRHLNRIISHRRTQLAKLDELVKCRFVEMFGDISASTPQWCISQIRDLVTVEPQNGLYKAQSFYVKQGATPILRIDAFYNGKVTDFTHLKRLKCTQEEIKKFLLKENDIVINRVNSIEYLGKCALIQGLLEDTVFESNMMRFHFDENLIDPVYATFLLSSRYTYVQILSKAKKAVNQASINQKDVLSINIPVPPLHMQQQFSSFVRRIDKLRFK